MTSAEIRQSFLDFFRSKQHTIVPSSSLLPDSPNLLFTNAGMNQFVPIFLGQHRPDVDKWPGAIPGLPTRAADTQKCIRAGGKHNDLDDVGLDTYHHTFFEMLGNWSFGDYFKKEAIEWAWELVVGRWKFPPARLYATVFCPHMQPDAWKSEVENSVRLAKTRLAGGKVTFVERTGTTMTKSDEEAASFWAEHFLNAGLDPFTHIIPGNKKDNFWMMGDTGPCGPCSEIHMDLTRAGNTKGSLVNTGDARCIEIWNLVFIQLNANPDGTFSPLPAKHVDTGMGFERVTSIIQCTRGFTDFANAKISNYETDIFRPIFDEIEKLSGKKYGSTLPVTLGGTGDSPVPLGGSPSGTGGTGLSPSDAGSVKNAPPPAAGLAAQRHGPVAHATQLAPGATYTQGNLPHFEKPWAIYHVIISTIAPRKLSPAARDIVFDCILHWRESRYQLVAACVMSDHAHFIIQPGVKEQDREGNPIFWPLSEILQSIKSYSAKEVNKLDNVKGTLWQQERYDRYMRSDRDLQEKFHYVCRNPWTAGLVQEDEPWPWLWTPEIEAVKPYVPLSMRKGSTGDSPVPLGDPPSGTGGTRLSPSDAGSVQDSPPPSAGLVAQRHGPVAHATQEQIVLDIAFRVIADHIRTLSFAIADGILPSNEGRGYVLRRILRRAVRYGRTLGFHEPFFYKLVDVLADTMGGVFPEIRAKQKHVQQVICTEEEAFNKTLDKGLELFESAVSTQKLFTSMLVECSQIIDRIEMRVSSLPDNYSAAQKHVKEMEADADQLFNLTKRIDLDSPVQAARFVALFSALMSSFVSSTVESLFSEEVYHKVLGKVSGYLAHAKSGISEGNSWKNQFGGREAFVLYDTYGFPFDLTELMARERGLTVDKAGFERLMEEQKARARAAQKKEVISLSQIETTAPTQFVGYDKSETPANVLEVVSVKDKTAVVLDTSVCYAEMGGQVGDTGELSHGGLLWRISNTQKSGNTWLHVLAEDRVERATGPSGEATRLADPVGGSPTGTGESPVLPFPGDIVTVSIDRPRRAAIQRHHTVTHLFHWALHEIVSKDATQKGSYVGPEKLTFDFNSGPLTPQQVADIEKLVNERILENTTVSWTEVPYADVKSRKDVLQFFGEKYGDSVRVVQIGGRPQALDGYSLELCGGTHTRATGEIGLFRIVAENAIAAGVRRIEAVAGLEAYGKATSELQLIKTLAGKVNSPVAELEKKIEAMLAQQKELEKQVKIALQRNASNAASELLGRAQTVNGIPMITHNLGDADGEFLQAIADALKGRFKGLVVLGGYANNAVALVATVSREFADKVQAGKIIQQIAPIVGGKGGGKPDNARGGGKDASKLDEALSRAKALLG